MSFDNNEQNNNKSLFIAVGLFMLFMVGYNYFFEEKTNSNSPTEQSQEEKESEEIVSKTPENSQDVDKKLTIKEAMEKASRVSIENSKLIASIDLTGGLIDSVVLKQYKQNTSKNSENVDILSPKDTENEFYYSIHYTNKKNKEKIDSETIWEKKLNETKTQSVTLKTEIGSGLIIERKITLDEGYMFSVLDRLINISDEDIKLFGGSDIIRNNPIVNNYAVVHEGLVGLNAVDNKVNEVKYSDISEKTLLGHSKWFGYTDIYWLISHINKSKDTTISYSKSAENSYKCSLTKNSLIEVKANSAIDVKYAMFAGPKEMSILKTYEKSKNIEKFDMAIDFGWFFMLTKPLLALLDAMSHIFKNMGIVILLLTLMFKIATYPLMKKSLKSAAKMREVQPKIALLQKSYAHDKQKLNQELMALYKKEQISPLSGCLPMLLQAPIFFCLYKVFFISIEMRHAPLFGWIQDLSAPDQLYIFNLFGAIDWDPPKFLQIGLWPLIMGISMFVQQKLSSSKSAKNTVEKTQEAKIQENMMLALPVLFTYICSGFPVGVVIYWTISNLFGIAQQHYINTHIGKRKR